MGNAIAFPNRRVSEGGGTGKVILADGSFHEYDEPLTVAELMLEYPQQMVIEFRPTKNLNANDYKRTAPLPADQKLETDKLYLMIPIRRGKPPGISSEEARRILLKANSFIKSKSSPSLFTGLLPFFARMCKAGNKDKQEMLTMKRNKLRVVRQGRQLELEMEEATKPADCFTDIWMDRGRPEFLIRQISGKGWKPSLDTITEKTAHAKVPHWLF